MIRLMHNNAPRYTPRATQTGFTIVEIIVAIGIMTMITVLYAVNVKGFQQGLIVQTNADQLAGVIRQVQVWALTGERINDARPDGGYGIYISSPCTNGICTALIFANTEDPDNHQYNVDSNCGDGGCDDLIRTDYFHEQVNVSGTNPSGNLTLLFTPPSAIMYRNGSPTNFSASITLTHRAQSGATKTISVDGTSGQVNVQ